MARHCSLSIAALSLLFCLSGTVLAQSHELSLRLVEFAAPAPATQPAAQPPAGATDGNVGAVLTPGRAAIADLPADATPVAELKLTVDLDRTFAVETKESKVVWNVVGQIVPTAAVDGAPVRLAIEVKYAGAGGMQEINTATIVVPGRETVLGGLTGQTGLCWTVLVTPKASGK